MTGCGIKILPQPEWDLLILASGMKPSFKIDGGMQENRKSHVTDGTPKATTLHISPSMHCNQAGSR